MDQQEKNGHFWHFLLVFILSMALGAGLLFVGVLFGWLQGFMLMPHSSKKSEFIYMLIILSADISILLLIQLMFYKKALRKNNMQLLLSFKITSVFLTLIYLIFVVAAFVELL